MVTCHFTFFKRFTLHFSCDSLYIFPRFQLSFFLRAHGAGAPPGYPLQCRLCQRRHSGSRLGIQNSSVIAGSDRRERAPQSSKPKYLRERSPRHFRCYPLRETCGHSTRHAHPPTAFCLSREQKSEARNRINETAFSLPSTFILYAPRNPKPNGHPRGASATKQSSLTIYTLWIASLAIMNFTGAFERCRNKQETTHLCAKASKVHSTSVITPM
jgi:hypothetical protein